MCRIKGVPKKNQKGTRHATFQENVLTMKSAAAKMGSKNVIRWLLSCVMEKNGELKHRECASVLFPVR